jgi:hypothetical protein
VALIAVRISAQIVARILVRILAAQIAALQNVATPISVIQIVAVVLAVVQISAQSAAVLTVVQIVVQTLAQSVVLVLAPLAVLPSRVDQLEESRVVVPVPADSRGAAVLCAAPARRVELIRSLADSFRAFAIRQATSLAAPSALDDLQDANRPEAQVPVVTRRQSVEAPDHSESYSY